MEATMPFSELMGRFVLAATLTTAFCVPLGLTLLKITGVPPTYPPLLPQQLLAGTVGGALLVTLGYALLTAILPEKKLRHTVFMLLAAVLTVASYQLAYRLTYTTSPRFAGVTVAAQIGQCLLHTIVVMLSAICFLSDKSGWE
jgi:mannose/fructose/N-acetylgalactosamine-specific phosphotransferase system component IIC